MKAFIALASLVFAAVGNAAVVTFSTQLNCVSPSETFRGDCNFCSDPPGDWRSVSFSDITDDNRVTVHNEDGCTPASQVGQGFGAACWNQGQTALRSAWVACPGQKRLANGTIVNIEDDDEATIVA